MQCGLHTIFVSIVLSFCHLDWAAAQELTIPPHRLDGGAQVAFTVSEALDSGAPDEILPNSTADRLFRYKVVPADLDWLDASQSQYGYFLFFCQRRGSTRVSRFKVSATPSGPFQDGWDTVSFSLREGSTTDKGTASFLMISTHPPDGLELVDAEHIYNVSLTGRTTLPLTLASKIANAKVQLSVPEVQSKDGLWRTPVTRSSPETMLVERGDFVQVAFELEPDIKQALMRSIVGLQSDVAQASFPLAVTYRLADFPNRARTLRGPAGYQTRPPSIRLRFAPELWSLPLALFCGLALGTVIRTMAVVVGWTTSVRTTIVAGGSTLVVWNVALILVALRSKFVLFNIELDPFQALPTFVLGAVGALMGTATYDALRRILKPA